MTTTGTGTSTSTSQGLSASRRDIRGSEGSFGGRRVQVLPPRWDRAEEWVNFAGPLRALLVPISYICLCVADVLKSLASFFQGQEGGEPQREEPLHQQRQRRVSTEEAITSTTHVAADSSSSSASASADQRDSSISPATVTVDNAVTFDKDGTPDIWQTRLGVLTVLYRMEGVQDKAWWDYVTLAKDELYEKCNPMFSFDLDSPAVVATKRLQREIEHLQERGDPEGAQRRRQDLADLMERGIPLINLLINGKITGIPELDTLVAQVSEKEKTRAARELQGAAKSKRQAVEEKVAYEQCQLEKRNEAHGAGGRYDGSSRRP